MYTSLEWLNELIDINSLELDELIEKLTLGGFEIEETLKINLNDEEKTILDISTTANRVDSLSIKGIAKEISALIDKSNFDSKYTKQKHDCAQRITNVIQTESLSTEYSIFIAITIENLIDLTVPNWINKKLTCSKINPVNNLLDFKNYILLETGYPFEFYDLEKIRNILNTSEFNISLSSLKSPIDFIGSNDIKYKLDNEILVVKANDFPISVAGIISNEKIAYDFATKSLLVEGSIFSSKKIRQQSRLMGLRTERSARYEKGLNNSYFVEALIRLLLILKVNNPDLICKIHTASAVEELSSKKSVLLKYENLIEILGPIQTRSTIENKNLSCDKITNYLKRLNFNFIFNDKQLDWSIEIPKSRMDDLQREIDLIEEIGRLHGYNNFFTNLPNVTKIGKEDFCYKVRRKLTNCFLNEGLNELIQYSLGAETTETTIPLINPLINDYSKLRTSLLPNLITLISENNKRGNIVLEGFEYGHIFEQNSEIEYKEIEVVSGIFGGIKRKFSWNEPAQSISWFEAKGRVDSLFNKFNISIIWKKGMITKYETILHPYRTAELWVDNTYLGIFGQIHPILAKKNNIPLDIFLFEYNLTTITNVFQNHKLILCQQYSNYPKVTKDLSFIINQTISYDEIRKTLFESETNYLIDVKLLDQYAGKSIPKNCISLCIQLIFQSDERTLINKEIDEIIFKLQLLLQNKYDVIIRL